MESSFLSTINVLILPLNNGLQPPSLEILQKKVVPSIHEFLDIFTKFLHFIKIQLTVFMQNRVKGG
jgi:hypothetical protein